MEVSPPLAVSCTQADRGHIPLPLFKDELFCEDDPAIPKLLVVSFRFFSKRERDEELSPPLLNRTS